MKLLLHTCCGPCFLGVWKELGDKNIEVTNYFYNPNIYPEEEYIKRLENLKLVAKGKSDLVVPGYEAKDYEKMYERLDSRLRGNDNKERCLGCYRLRLENTAKYAKEHEFDAFSTTLLISPYQNHEVLREIGTDIAEKFGLQFYYTDWRPYFRPGQEEAKIIPIYRQKYCGCVHSLNERNI